MSEMGPRNEDEAEERFHAATKDAMARDLMSVYGTSYARAMELVEDMFKKARQDKENQSDTDEEEN